MPTTKSAEVQFIPANLRGSGMIEIKYGSLLHSTHPMHTLTFTTVDELLAQIAAEAEKLGDGRYASVRLPNGTRKPPGWDAKTMQLFYGLDEPADAAQPAA
jgi:hypothetical protein